MSLKPSDTVAELERHLSELKRSIAKCEPKPEEDETDPLDKSRADYHCAYVKALHWQIKRPSWSYSHVARTMGFHVTMVTKWRDHGWRKDSPIPGYVHLRMPEGMRAVFERELRALEFPLSEASNG